MEQDEDEEEAADEEQEDEGQAVEILEGGLSGLPEGQHCIALGAMCSTITSVYLGSQFGAVA